MHNRLRWGILGAASIARRKVIPGIQASELNTVAALASRDAAKAAAAAAELDIPRHYGSYEELLADPEIDVIYNPLPNHLHVPWSIRALDAGKHVLCEKPLALSSGEIRQLIAARDRAGLQAGEGFMVRLHPQWLRVKELVDGGTLGPLRLVQSWFSYDNRNPQNVRNVAGYGGGGLMDIGCYPIFISRFLFGAEPRRVSGSLEYDPEFKTDRLASAVLEYPSGHCVFSCSTQLVYGQRVIVFCERGLIDVEVPFNPLPDREARIRVNGAEVVFPACDQFSLQADAFARAVRGEAPVPVPLEDSLGTMAVIEALKLMG